MRIGELGKQAGASVRALRYYEEQGLLTAQRSTTGQRHYPQAAVERVRFIRQLFAAGLSSRTVRQVLPCVDAPDHATTARSAAVLIDQRDRIDAQIAALIGTRDTLDQLVAASQACLARGSEAATPHVPEESVAPIG